MANSGLEEWFQWFYGEKTDPDNQPIATPSLPAPNWELSLPDKSASPRQAKFRSRTNINPLIVDPGAPHTAPFVAAANTALSTLNPQPLLFVESLEGAPFDSAWLKKYADSTARNLIWRLGAGAPATRHTLEAAAAETLPGCDEPTRQAVITFLDEAFSALWES